MSHTHQRGSQMDGLSGRAEPGNDLLNYNLGEPNAEDVAQGGAAEGAPQSFAKTHKVKRRSIVAFSYTSTALKEKLAVVEKTDDERRLIQSGLRMSPLTNTLSLNIRGALVDVLVQQTFAAGEVVVKQGDLSNTFYCLVEGHCDIFKVDKDGAATPDLPYGPKVNEVDPGQSFGDLALIYGAPRAATVIATKACVSYEIAGNTFRSFLRSEREKEIAYCKEFLRKMGILSNLTDTELFAIAQACIVEEFPAGKDIIREGDVGDRFYFVQSGDVAVLKGGAVFVNLHANDYFGESAFLNNEPRNATVRALVPVRTYSLDRESFIALLGPIKTIQARTPTPAPAR